MHDIAMRLAAAHDVGHYFTKSQGKKALVQVFDGGVNLVFGGANASLAVFVSHSDNIKCELIGFVQINLL
jgi:hypothetical protein